MKVRIFFALFIFTAFSGLAAAQYTGPGAAHVYETVEQIIKKPVDDAKVILKGFIIRQVSRDKYIFMDGTGEIRVDIDEKIFPKDPIGDKTKVEIRGEIEQEFLESPEIDVDFIRIME